MGELGLELVVGAGGWEVQAKAAGEGGGGGG
jgi:hypothetical protein